MPTDTLSISVFGTEAEAWAEKKRKEADKFQVKIWRVSDAVHWSDETDPKAPPVSVHKATWVVVANR